MYKKKTKYLLKNYFKKFSFNYLYFRQNLKSMLYKELIQLYIYKKFNKITNNDYSLLS